MLGCLKRFFGKKEKEEKFVEIMELEIEDGKIVFPPGTNLREIDILQLTVSLSLQTKKTLAVSKDEDGLRIDGVLYPY